MKETLHPNNILDKTAVESIVIDLEQLIRLYVIADLEDVNAISLLNSVFKNSVQELRDLIEAPVTSQSG